MRGTLFALVEFVAALTTLVVMGAQPSAAASSTVAVSLTPSGASAGDANGLGSRNPVISADGRWVAFESYSDELVQGDTNHDVDVFIHDARAAVTTRVSVSADGAEVEGGGSSPAISADGRLVAFNSWSPALVPGDTNMTRASGTTSTTSASPSRPATFSSATSPLAPPVV